MIGRKDIAEKAGVSKTTVTRVLSGSAAVSEDTRKKIMRVIDETGYVYNEVAGRLSRRKHTAVVALLVPDMTNYYLQLFDEMSRRAQAYGFIISIFAVNGENFCYVLDTVIANRVTCIVNMGFTAVTEEYLRKIKNAGIGIVHPGTGADAFDYRHDYKEAVGKLARKFVEAGARRFCFLFCMPERLKHDARLCETVEALQALDVQQIDVVYGNVTEESTLLAGYKYAKELLQSNKKYDVLFCLNDMLAIGAMRALKEAGVKIPDDVSVVGHDNIRLGEFESPSLTTIDINAEFEAQTYIDYIAGKLQQEKVVNRCSVILRESTDFTPKNTAR